MSQLESTAFLRTERKKEERRMTKQIAQMKPPELHQTNRLATASRKILVSYL